MGHTTFVAFSSSDSFVAETISDVCRSIKIGETEYVPWNRNDTSGQPIERAIFDWIDDADAFVADISEPNHNVTYEVGLAIGMGKPVRLIRATNKDRRSIEEIGLLHNLGHDDYSNHAQLLKIFEKLPQIAPWPQLKRKAEVPIYFVQPSVTDDLVNGVLSGIKKTIKLKFRSFNPGEIDRLTAAEAYEQVVQSFGVVAIWPESGELRQYQRASFVIGLARGLEIPYLLLANRDQRLPLDLDEIAARWTTTSDLDAILRNFRENVLETIESFSESRPAAERPLDLVDCGDPAAENEATRLENYFLETEQFRLTLAGELNILLGRKGSGKTAVFLQVRDKTRANKRNIVIDLQPVGFQLVKLKEFIIQELSHGSRKEFIAAFWEYIVWLEIARKLLEKDSQRLRVDSRIFDQYERLSMAYRVRVEGSGDFSERLTKLTERILARYELRGTKDAKELSSSQILEIVYGREIHAMREEVLDYLRVKGVVFFLFDNLDRFWTPRGFGEIDSLLVIGLIESLVEIRKRFSQARIQFLWAIFLRSDVYEFVVKGMADYGKLSVASTEWNDRELLFRLFEKRVTQGFDGARLSWREIWQSISVPSVHGKSTIDFLIDASLMRPRYLIRLFETARRRAVTLGKEKIEEADYDAALQELGWQVLEDFDRELIDVIPNAEQLLFEIAVHGSEMSLNDLRKVISTKVADPKTVELAIDVLIWTGCIGVRNEEKTTYISDCGFKRPFMRALMSDPEARSVVFHPTVASVITAPHQSAPAS
jgi:hypothetical protein